MSAAGSQWSNVAIIVGAMLLVLGLSGFRGSVNREGMLSRYNQAAAFPSEARLEMMVGAALIVTGILYRRSGGK